MLMAAAMCCAPFTVTAEESLPAPKYIFYYIGDGMGVSPVITAETYNRDILRSPRPLLMLQFPVASMCYTYSASDPVTDSAAAGTALSTGHKTRNGMLGMGPDTTAVTSIASQLFDRGWGVGIVTSVAADDATPGAFYAHVPYRKMYRDIDLAAARCGYDFIAGAGMSAVTDSAVVAAMTENGVQLVRGASGIAEINSRRVVLLADESAHPWNIGYTIDSIAGALTLPVMAEACLTQLERNGRDRFFMMVEGGNIDHALHANDGGAAVKEIIKFNEALAVAYDFYLRHPDETLIVVTADHDTGGSALIRPEGAPAPNLGLYDWQRVSKEEFSDFCKNVARRRDIFTWDDMARYLTDNLGFFTHIPVSPEGEQMLRDKFEAAIILRNSPDQETLYANFNDFAVTVFEMLNDAAGVGFTTTNHSGMPAPVFAVGVGADLFRHMNNNSDLPGIMRRIAGL